VRANGEAPRGITFQPDIYPKVLGLLPPTPGARVLDLGAGEGYFARLLLERGFAVEACDHDPARFKASGVPFHRADLNQGIPLPDQNYDCVVSIEVLEHLENHTRFVSELMRVTRVGGTVILTTPNVLSLPSRWHFFLYGYTDCSPLPLDPTRPDYFMQHINPISLPEILFLLERFGGELVELHTNRLRKSAVPALLLYPVLALALRGKLLRSKHREARALHRRHLRWMLHHANLMGRITIAVGRRVR
jgi:2-polyprenyl-3-methyl-5-hydroxy-6-metoxy-1,4-benzoquinol methylase